jgi:S-adenosylmethionine hydrolase
VYNYETGEIELKTTFSIVWPNTWGSVNTTEILRSPEDLDELCEEIKEDAFNASLLKNTFHRRDVFEESNVRLHRVLAFQIIVDQFPTGWLFK